MKRLLLFIPGLVAAGIGALLGAVPTAVEPQGQFVDCGPALFHRRGVLPDATCSSAYEPFQTLAVVLFVIAAVLLVLAAVQTVRRQSARADAGSPEPATERQTVLKN